MLHGGGQTRHAWTETAEALALLGWLAISVDLRGHGRSSGDWLTYGVRESRDLSQVIDALSQRGASDEAAKVLEVLYELYCAPVSRTAAPARSNRRGNKAKGNARVRAVPA